MQLWNLLNKDSHTVLYHTEASKTIITLVPQKTPIIGSIPCLEDPLSEVPMYSYSTTNHNVNIIDALILCGICS